MILCGRKGLVAIVGMMALASVSAMPTDDEIKKVNPIIEQLTAGDHEAMKAGKKTRSQVADTLVGYVKDAESEAAKLVLLREAFGLYLGAAEFSKALYAFSLLDGNVKDVPKGTLGAWCMQSAVQLAKKGRADGLAALIDKAVANGDAESAAELVRQIRPYRRKLMSAQTGPQLQTALNRAEQLERGMREIRTLRQSVRKRPDDATLREKLGFALAAAGDWSGALKEFAQAAGKIAEAATWERSYPETGVTAWTTETVANFWWERAEQTKDAPTVAAACRRHAADWFRVAIDNGTLTGLKKTLAEKRIAEAEKADNRTIRSTDSKPVSISDGNRQMSADIKTSVQNNVKMHTIKLNDKVSMEFVECPAGSFIMGFENEKSSALRRHKVTITRPFWIARTKVTLRQYKAWDKTFKVPKELAATAKDDHVPLSFRYFAFENMLAKNVSPFCKALTDRFRNVIPEGYIFRLPTEAEWEYAYTANETNPNDFYGASGNLLHKWPKSKWQKYMFDRDTLASRAKKLCGRYGYGIGVAVGQLRPNRWGLYDMAGNWDEKMLDGVKDLIIDSTRVIFPHEDIYYEDEEIDPLRYTARGSNLVRGGDLGKWGKRLGGCCIRLVVGPDLLKEKYE